MSSMSLDLYITEGGGGGPQMDKEHHRIMSYICKFTRNGQRLVSHWSSALSFGGRKICSLQNNLTCAPIYPF